MGQKTGNIKPKKAPKSWKATAEALADSKAVRDIREGLKDLLAGKCSRVRDDIDV